MIAVGFRSDELTVGGATPKVGTAGLEKAASDGAKRTDELARGAALKSGPRQIEKEPLEGFVRLRRIPGVRIAPVSTQSATLRFS